MISELQHRLFLGFKGMMVQVPLFFSERGLRNGVKGAREVSGALTYEERLVHHYIVRKMTVANEPITIDLIADDLDIPGDQVLAIVNKLEAGKIFIYRSDGKTIDWAFPFSLQDTGFRMTASTGERFFAA